MREIKFRAISDDTNLFIYGYLAWNKGSDGFIGTDDGNMYGIKEKTIGQYTGLKDKNGKEIYEGDIVKYNSRNYEVYWGSTYGRWCLKRICAVIEKPHWYQSKIMGNIYENPGNFTK